MNRRKEWHWIMKDQAVESQLDRDESVYFGEFVPSSVMVRMLEILRHLVYVSTGAFKRTLTKQKSSHCEF